MNSQSFQSHSPEATQQIAVAFIQELLISAKKNKLVALIGELGSGKTCFAKGAIHALTQTPLDEITSPTFTLVESYEIDPTISLDLKLIYHVDLYRIETVEALDSLGWEDWLEPDVITLIEWPERFPQLISHCQWQLNFSKGEKEERRITIASKKTL